LALLHFVGFGFNPITFALFGVFMTFSVILVLSYLSKKDKKAEGFYFFRHYTISVVKFLP
jgi:amino acid transporter